MNISSSEMLPALFGNSYAHPYTQPHHGDLQDPNIPATRGFPFYQDPINANNHNICGSYTTYRVLKEKSSIIQHASSTDSSSLASRCSVRLIHDIVSNFCLQKKDLVRAIGFGGLLYFPSMKQINLKFSAWLMSRVDEFAQTLKISDSSSIQFSKDDVAKVFGIPSSGLSLFSRGSRQSYSKDANHSYIGELDVKQLRSTKAALAILDRNHQSSMSLHEQHEFKAAFVVFVMSTLLAPIAKHDRVPDDYMHIIANTDLISSYDWADYGMRRLLEAVSKFKADIATNVKVPYIYGCSLFLQVLYLDSIDLGALSLEHNVFPRVRCFNSDRLRVMIAADRAFSSNLAANIQSTHTKLRPMLGLCYHWAAQKSSTSIPREHSNWQAMWDLSVLMTKVLKIPNEAAGPIFVAAVEFQKKMSDAHGNEAIHFMSVLLHIMEPYVSGFSYHSSINGLSIPLAICSSWQSYISPDSNDSPHRLMQQPANICAICSFSHGTSIDLDSTVSNQFTIAYIDTTDHTVSPLTMHNQTIAKSQDVLSGVINAMARFYLSIRPVKSVFCTDLNTSLDNIHSVKYTTHLQTHQLQTKAPSPWQLGAVYNSDSCNSRDFYKKLHLVEDIDEPWVVHYCPKYIEVTTYAAKSQFMGKSEFELDLFDAVFRCFKQADDQLYASSGLPRWRHFVETDFMVSLIAGCSDLCNHVLRSNFIGRHISYDVTSCEMIFFPAMLQHRWVCFSWRISDNTIVVYDPCFSAHPENAPVSCYDSVSRLIKCAMQRVSSISQKVWHVDWEKARLEIFRHPLSMDHNSMTNRTGVMCLHFCRCFDGQRLRYYIDPPRLDEMAAALIGDLGRLEGNIGRLPRMCN